MVNFSEGLMCLSIEWKLYTCRNSNREQLRKIHQLSVLRQESNLRLCDAGALLRPVLILKSPFYWLKTQPIFEDQLLIPNRNPMTLLFAGSYCRDLLFIKQ